MRHSVRSILFAVLLAAALFVLARPAGAVSICVPSCTQELRAQMAGAFAGTPILDFSSQFPDCGIPAVDPKYASPIGGGPVEFDALLAKVADDYGLGDRKVTLKAMMLLESNANPNTFNPNPGSYDVGLLQINNVYVGRPYWPGYAFRTAPDFSSPMSAWCPQTNLMMGVDEFKRCLARWQGSERDALCCYNTGKACTPDNANGYKYLSAYSNARARVYGYAS